MLWREHDHEDDKETAGLNPFQEDDLLTAIRRQAHLAPVQQGGAERAQAATQAYCGCRAHAAAVTNRPESELVDGLLYGPPANRKRRLVAIDDSRLSIRPIAIRSNPDLACMMKSHASVPISGAA